MCCILISILWSISLFLSASSRLCTRLFLSHRSPLSCLLFLFTCTWSSVPCSLVIFRSEVVAVCFLVFFVSYIFFSFFCAENVLLVLPETKNPNLFSEMLVLTKRSEQTEPINIFFFFFEKAFWGVKLFTSVRKEVFPSVSPGSPFSAVHLHSHIWFFFFLKHLCWCSVVGILFFSLPPAANISLLLQAVCAVFIYLFIFWLKSAPVCSPRAHRKGSTSSAAPTSHPQRPIGDMVFY